MGAMHPFIRSLTERLREEDKGPVTERSPMLAQVSMAGTPDAQIGWT